jgi:hypothetical protein
MLLAAGRMVVAEAERQTERHQPIVPPVLPVDALLRSACEYELRSDLSRRQAAAEASLQLLCASHPELAEVAERFRSMMEAPRDPRGRPRKRLNRGEADRDTLERYYNPSRAMALLERRGLVMRMPPPTLRRGFVKSVGYHRKPGFWLTGAGLAEAIRLGDLQSGVVDLEWLIAGIAGDDEPDAVFMRLITPPAMPF